MQFSLRPWREEDALTLPEAANNPKVAENLRNIFPHPYTISDAEKYIRFCMEAEDSQLLRAIEVDGRAVGGISVTPGGDVYRKSGELGYWLAESCWGRGVMTGAVAEICAAAFERFGLIRIYAEPFARNLASRRVLEKNGFQLEGILKNAAVKNGEILDTCIYGLIR